MQPGMPTDADYQRVIQSESYLRLDEYSKLFIEEHEQTLKAFSRKWVANPLHQWSRRLEYPFVFQAIQSLLASSEAKSNSTSSTDTQTVKILDAGSGVTFFPFFLRQLYPQLELYCCDYDAAFSPAYDRLNAILEESEETSEVQSSPVHFDQGDLRHLPYSDNQFDLIYCISVLEHTDCYEEILSEFNRVLSVGGKLVISFDVSIDGNRDISLDEAEHLLACVNRYFTCRELDGEHLRSKAAASDLFTTHKARVIDPKLLPWKYPSLLYQCQSLLKGRGMVAWPPKLGVYCLVAEK